MKKKMNLIISYKKVALGQTGSVPEEKRKKIIEDFFRPFDEKGQKMNKVMNLYITENWTALMVACRSGNSKTVEILLNAGYGQINNKNTSGETALMIADKHGHQNIVNLLSHQSLVSLLSIYKDDPKQATTPYTKEVVLKHGNIPSFTNNPGWTPLMFACKGGHNELVKTLLDPSKDNQDIPEASDLKKGYLLTEDTSSSMHSLLMEAGKENPWIYIDHKEPVEDNKPVIHLCTSEKMLIDENTEILFSVELYQMLELLINAGALMDFYINQRDENGDTPLMYACRYGDYTTVKLILEAGAKDKINIGNKRGKTALHYAYMKYDWSMIMLLVNNGALSSKDNFGRTPLMAMFDQP